MRLSKMAITAMLMLWAGANAFADISGLYLRGSPTSLEAAQIVETSDGQLTGRMESYTVGESGKISPNSVGFDGSVSVFERLRHS
ncbi:hypothetical protein, partial [Hyphomonas pacifica]|uniref:hypothetical protein n=1 Tax=Hyphomonas pacifica TaxID=1280941 RepID=UPI0019D6CB10